MLTNSVINQISKPVKLHLQVMLEIVQTVKLMEDSLGTGVGIAAVQVGILERIIIVKINGEFITMINPVIVKKSQQTKISEEGCLSFPGKMVKKKRNYRITVEYADLDLNPQLVKLSGLASFIAQHEIDHLNGLHI